MPEILNWMLSIKMIKDVVVVFDRRFAHPPPPFHNPHFAFPDETAASIIFDQEQQSNSAAIGDGAKVVPDANMPFIFLIFGASITLAISILFACILRRRCRFKSFAQKTTTKREEGKWKMARKQWANGKRRKAHHWSKKCQLNNNMSSIDSKATIMVEEETVLPIGCSIPSLPSPGSLHNSTSSPSICSSGSPKTTTTKSSFAELTCKKCPGGRTFPCLEQLNLHLANTHRDRPQYCCAQCGASFSIKRELATHNRIHSGEQPHQCDKCGKEFGTRQLLKKHNMWHTGDRSHVCPHCGKAFFQKGHLTQHLQIHKGGRPHKCHLCMKTFIFKFDLNRHLKIHSDRSFVCKKCSKCFQLECELEEHLTKCRGGERIENAGERRRGSKSSTKSKKSPMSLSLPSTSSPSGATVENGQDGHMMEAENIESNVDDAPKLEAASPTVPYIHANGIHHSPVSNHQNEAISRLAASILNAQAQQNAINGFLSGTEQQFPCLLCSQKFNNQTAYLLHWSNVHMIKREGMGAMKEPQMMMKDEGRQPPPTTLLMQMQQSMGIDAFSPQKVSPSSSSTITTADSLAQSQFEQHFPPSTMATMPGPIAFPSNGHNPQCQNCPIERQRLAEKERELEEMRAELDKIRILFLRFGALLSGTMTGGNGNGNAGGFPFQQFLLGQQFPPQN